MSYEDILRERGRYQRSQQRAPQGYRQSRQSNHQNSQQRRRPQTRPQQEVQQQEPRQYKPKYGRHYGIRYDEHNPPTATNRARSYLFAKYTMADRLWDVGSFLLGGINPASAARVIKNRVNKLQQEERKAAKEFEMTHKQGKKTVSQAKNILNNLTLIVPGVLLIGMSFNGIVTYLNDLQTFEGGGLFGGGFGGSGRSSGKMSDQGVHDLLQYEAFKPNAYHLDGEKYWTIGYGHNGPDVKPGDTITKEAAMELFKKDLARFENCVNSSVTVPISQNMFDALVSLCYNIGEGAFKSSTLLKKLNEGDYKGAQQEFMKWNKDSTKKESAGLTTRRQKEAAKFGIDITSDNKLAVPEINGLTGGGKQVDVGNKIGNFNIGKDVKMSEQMAQFLGEVNMTKPVTVTSVMDGVHQGQGKAINPKSHYSGNKADIGLNGMSVDQIVEVCVPIMRHPAIYHVAIEGLGKNHNDSIAISKQVEQKIRNSYPDIAKRIVGNESQVAVNNDKFLIHHWGWKYTKRYAPHLDILIKQNKLGTSSGNVNQGNQVQPTKDIPKDKPKQNPTPAKSTQTPQSGTTGVNNQQQTPKKRDVNLNLPTRQPNKKKQ